MYVCIVVGQGCKYGLNLQLKSNDYAENEVPRLINNTVSVAQGGTVLSPWLAADEARVSHVLSHVV